MRLKILLESKGFKALLTFVGFFRSVNFHVRHVIMFLATLKIVYFVVKPLKVRKGVLP